MNSDPRVFFAAERTLLAWIRLGMTLMALGFVVDKFSLFLTLLSVSGGAVNHLNQNIMASHFFGIILVIVGTLLTAGAHYNYRNYVKLLPKEDVPNLAIGWLTSVLTLFVVFAGAFLTLFLALV